MFYPEVRAHVGGWHYIGWFRKVDRSVYWGLRVGEGDPESAAEKLVSTLNISRDKFGVYKFQSRLEALQTLEAIKNLTGV